MVGRVGADTNIYQPAFSEPFAGKHNFSSEIPEEVEFPEQGPEIPLAEEAQTLATAHENLKAMLIGHLQRCIDTLEELAMYNISNGFDLKEYLEKMKDDLKKSSTSHGTLKIVFGILTAAPVLITGINTVPWFNGKYKPELLQKMGESIMYMLRQFGEATSVFIQGNQDVMKTDQRFQMDALDRIKEKLRTIHESQRAEGESTIRSLDTWHSGTRAN